MSNSDGFAVYAKLTARPGEGHRLVAELVAAAQAGIRAGGFACSVNTIEGEPDAVWVAEAWPDRPTHDAIAHGPALADVTRRVTDLLAAPPVFTYGTLATLEVARDGAANLLRGLGQRLYAALDARDWGQLETLVAPDVIVQLGSGPAVDLEHWRRSLTTFASAFPDGRHVIDEALVEGDRLVTRCRFRGTHTGPFGDVAPTGAAVSVGVIHVDRFRDGRLVEHRGQLDLLGLLQQIHAPGVASTAP